MNPDKKKIIVVGAGWGGATFTENIDKTKYDIIMISSSKFVYTPLLTKSAVFGSPCLESELSTFIIKNTVTDVDLDQKIIYLNNGSSLKGDYLVFAHGAVVNTFNIEGVDKFCYFINDLYSCEKLYNKIKSLPDHSKVVIIGCGPAGVELTGNLLDLGRFNLYTVDALERPMFNSKQSVSAYVSDFWKHHFVTSYFKKYISKIDSKNIIDTKNKTLPYDLAIWCGGNKNNMLTNCVLDKLYIKNKAGIPVDSTFKVTDHVYAIGDCADSGYLKTAQVVSQQGLHLAKYFNHNFTAPKFTYHDKGQFCYIGKKQSIYSSKNYFIGGRIAGYLNNFLHIYHAINYKQKKSFVFDRK